MKKSCAVVILAAGKGTRMGGTKAKVLVESFSGPLIIEVLKSALDAQPERIAIVVGFEGEEVQKTVENWVQQEHPKYIDKLSFCPQKEQRGTGDAVKAALPALEEFQGEVLILCGDTPLLAGSTLTKLIEQHQNQNATVSILTALMPQPASYGRIVRDSSSGEITAIVEAKDASPAELLIQEINSGVYVAESAFLPGALHQLESDNAQGEFYLTDIVQRASQEGQRVSSLLTTDHAEAFGVNTFQDLHDINQIQQERVRNIFAASGVSFLQPHSCVISPCAKIGSNVSIGPNTVIGKGVQIGDRVTIEGNCYLQNTSVDKDSILKWGLRIEGATIGAGSMVGPFAHLRPGTVLGKEVKVGNFVETKKATLHDGAKASHLTYLGDATIGKDANIGAGTITCNYDGYQKFETVVEEGAFIGSNTALVAPVRVGKGATVGAGSTISKDVKEDSLAVTRAEQKTLEGWSKKKREKLKKAAKK